MAIRKPKLKISPSKKIRGIRVVLYCVKCQRELNSSTCKKTKGDASLCPYSESHHAFRYYLHQPGTKQKKVARILKGTKNIDEVYRIAMNHKQQLRNGRITQSSSFPIQIVNNGNVLNEQPSQGEQKEQILLKNLLAEHLNLLSDFERPEHLIDPKSKDYLSDISRGYKYMCMGLKKEGHDLETFCVSGINDNAVAAVHKFLLHEKHFSNRSYSKYMQYYITFSNYAIEQGYAKVNYFKKVPLKVTHYTPEVIDKETFEKLLECITPENGIQLNPEQKKKYRNMYKSWLSFALRISLETGRRRPEIANLKYSDIYSQDGMPIYVKVADSKVNNIKNLKDSAMKFVYVPVTKNLYELIKSDYEEYLKNKVDRYIVAPEITEKREERICDALSRGFSHFYSKIAGKENEKPLHFGCLRKTYLTRMSIHTSGNAQLVSGHGSGGVILNKHYIDPKAIASVSAAKGFEVFPEEDKRKRELTQIREKETKEKTIER